MMPESSLQTKEGEKRAIILEGAPIAEEIKRDTADWVARLDQEHGVRPCLVVVRVGDDPASAIYVRNKVQTSLELGLVSEHRSLPAETTTAELLELVRELNTRDEVDGMLVQLPLPPGIDE